MFAGYQQNAGSDHFMWLPEGRGEGQYSTSCNLDEEAGALAMAWLQGVRGENGRGSGVDAR